MPRPDFAVLYLGTVRLSGGLLGYVYSVAPGWRVTWVVAPGADMPDHDDPAVITAVTRLREGLPP